MQNILKEKRTLTKKEGRRIKSFMKKFKQIPIDLIRAKYENIFKAKIQKCKIMILALEAGIETALK